VLDLPVVPDFAKGGEGWYMNLALIGYRGTGKTTVARHVALALGWDWVDADVELERRAGKSIAAVFADDGEAAFRDLESQILAELVHRNAAVLALGGGVILRAENRVQLGRCSCIVWLTATAATIARRVAGDESTAQRRPKLTVADGLEEIATLLREREPYYRQCASLVVDTEDRSPREVAGEILRGLPASFPRGDLA
jgi:shikimate kinase